MSLWTRLTLAFPFWLVQTVIHSLATLLGSPWFIYPAAFSLFMLSLSLLSYVTHALRGVLPLPTPIARALGRDKQP